MATQTIKNGTRVTFMVKGLTDDLAIGMGITKEYLIQHYANKGCVVKLCHTKPNECGDREYEYYTIYFDNGATFEGVSGYHLHDIPWKYGNRK